MNDKMNIEFYPKADQLNNFLDSIKLFGKISYNKYTLRECPKNIKEIRKFIITGDYRNIITKTGTDNYYSGTICENELDTSIEEHKWKIKILKTKNKYILVGVAQKNFDFNKANYDTCGFYLNCIYSPPTLYSGPPFNYNGFTTNLSGINNEIVLIMNMKKRKLKFIINNEDKGDSYINIPIDKLLFPDIILYNKDDSVEICEY